MGENVIYDINLRKAFQFAQCVLNDILKYNDKKEISIDKFYLSYSDCILGNRRYIIKNIINNYYSEVIYNDKEDTWYVNTYKLESKRKYQECK